MRVLRLFDYIVLDPAAAGTALCGAIRQSDLDTEVKTPALGGVPQKLALLRPGYKRHSISGLDRPDNGTQGVVNPLCFRVLLPWHGACSSQVRNDSLGGKVYA